MNIRRYFSCSVLSLESHSVIHKGYSWLCACGDYVILGIKPMSPACKVCTHHTKLSLWSTFLRYYSLFPYPHFVVVIKTTCISLTWWWCSPGLQSSWRAHTLAAEHVRGCSAHTFSVAVFICTCLWYTGGEILCCSARSPK